MKLRRIHCRLEIAFSDVVAMHQICAFLYIGRNKRQVLLQARVTLSCRADGVLEKLLGWNMIVTDEIDLAQNRLWQFGYIKDEARSARNEIVDIYFGIPLLAVENLDKNGGVRCSGGRYSKILLCWF